MQANRTLVLGIGNILLGDEGVGVHAVRALDGSRLPPDVQVMDGGTLSFTLAGPLADADRLIVVDAADLKAAPATVRTYQGADMDHFLGTHPCSSVHEVSLRDLMEITLLSGGIPEKRALVAIQPADLSMRDGLSEKVRAVLPQVHGRIQALIEEWNA